MITKYVYQLVVVIVVVVVVFVISQGERQSCVESYYAAKKIMQINTFRNPNPFFCVMEENSKIGHVMNNLTNWTKKLCTQFCYLILQKVDMLTGLNLSIDCADLALIIIR